MISSDGSDVVADPAGGVLLTGTTSSQGAGGDDIFLARFDTAGQQLWNQTWGGTGDDGGNGIRLDTDGNVFVVGSTTSFGAGLADMAIVKYANLNVPVAPAGVQASPGNGHVNVTWSAPDDGGTPIMGYRLYWSTDSVNFNAIDVGLVQAFTHGSLTNGQRYYYKVAAINMIGQGPNSTTVSAMPGVPTQVQSVTVNAGDGQINLTWTTPDDGGSPITGYSLYWSMNNASFAKIDLGNVVIYQHSGLDDGQVYYYKVAAVNTNGEGANSSVATTTTWDVPAQVTELTATPGDAHVNLTWTAPSNGGSLITGYSFYWSTDSLIFTKISLGIILGYQHSELVDGQVYYYKIAAVNVIGEGANSSVVSTTTWGVPAPVTGLVAIPGEGHVNLTWTAPADGGSLITGYNLYWSTDNISFARIALGLVLEYQHGGLTVGQTYYYKVAAVNAIGEGKNSSVVITAAYDDPAQVTGLVAIPGNKQVNLTWIAPNDGGSSITGYSIYWSIDNAIFARIDLGNVLEYPHGGLNVGQVYYYKVAAVNIAGEGENSTVVFATTWDVPAQVTGLLAIPGDRQVNLTWNTPGNGGSAITGYSLYWSTNNIIFTRIDLGVVLEYPHGGLNVGQAYYYKVSAVNVLGEGENSTVAFTTTWDVPAQVTGLVATSGNHQVNLNWTAPLDGGSLITGYKIYRALATGGEYSLAGTSFDTGFKDTGLAPGTTYYYKVAAVNLLGEGANSSIASCATRMPPGVPSVTHVTISPTTSLVISLSWSPVPGAETYIVYRYSQPITSGNIQSAFIVMNSSATRVNDTVPGTGTYWYSVVAVNASGASIPSSSMKVIVVAPPGQDWVIIIVIGVGIAAVVAVSIPTIKRRFQVKKKTVGKGGKAKDYVNLPGKEKMTSQYADLDKSVFAPNPIEPMEKNPGDAKDLDMTSDETTPLRKTGGIATVFEPEVLAKIAEFDIDKTVVGDLLVLLKDVPPSKRVQYLEDFIQDTRENDSDDI